jgi:chorismate mutase
MDPHREAEVVRHAAARARTADLDDECVRGIFWRIIELSRRVQQEST